LLTGKPSKEKNSHDFSSSNATIELKNLFLDLTKYGAISCNILNLSGSL